MLEEFPYKSGKRQEYALLPLLFSTVLVILVNAIREEKFIRGKDSVKK